MTIKVETLISKNIYLSGEVVFSSNHDIELVRSWVKSKMENGDPEDQQDLLDHIHWFDEMEEIEYDERDTYDEGQGGDNCLFDEEIQEWKENQDQ